MQSSSPPRGRRTEAVVPESPESRTMGASSAWPRSAWPAVRRGGAPAEAPKIDLADSVGGSMSSSSEDEVEVAVREPVPRATAATKPTRKRVAMLPATSGGFGKRHLTTAAAATTTTTTTTTPPLRGAGGNHARPSATSLRPPDEGWRAASRGSGSGSGALAFGSIARRPADLVDLLAPPPPPETAAFAPPPSRESLAAASASSSSSGAPAAAAPLLSATTKAAYDRGVVGRKRALALGQVSDNFVRQDLTRKGTYRKRAQRGNAQPKRRAFYPRDDGDLCDARRAIVDGAHQTSSHPAVASSSSSSSSSRDKQATDEDSLLELGTRKLDAADDFAETEEARLVAFAPRCAAHSVEARALAVKKSKTGNKGRFFYCCALPRDDQCDFFSWADDHPPYVRAKLAALDRDEADDVVWRGRVARDRDAKRAGLSIPELKAECRRRHLAYAASAAKRFLLAALKADDLGRIGAHFDPARLRLEEEAKAAADAAPSKKKQKKRPPPKAKRPARATTKKPHIAEPPLRRPRTTSSRQAKLAADDALRELDDASDEADDESDDSEDRPTRPHCRTIHDDDDDDEDDEDDDEDDDEVDDDEVDDEVDEVDDDDEEVEVVDGEAHKAKRAEEAAVGRAPRVVSPVVVAPRGGGRGATPTLVAVGGPPPKDNLLMVLEDSSDDESLELEVGDAPGKAVEVVQISEEATKNKHAGGVFFSSCGAAARVGASGSAQEAPRQGDEEEEEDGHRVVMAPMDALRLVFGHGSFRSGQEWAVDRVVSGRSGIVVLPTGAGKSLCFQLPAAVLDGVVVVVSPLVALIDEQIVRLPPELYAVSLSGGSLEDRARALRDVERGRCAIVYVSPERLCSRAFSTAFAASGRRCALLAVDEAHCVSQWSHNFRPAFSKIGAAARRVLNPRCTLALTATASTRVVAEIAEALHLDARDAADGGDVQRADWRRPNLALVVTAVDDDVGVSSSSSSSLAVNLADEAKLAELLRFFAPAHVAQRTPAIVYVRAQADADRVAERLRAQDLLTARAYHAGLPRHDRARCARDFARGALRVVVATIAFGMGVDKSDVRSVVHFCAPSSLERYVQEVGRAGRDGKPSTCVTLFARADARRNASLAASDGLERRQLDLFVGRFASSSGGHAMPPPNAVVACPLDVAAMTLDLRAEVVETLVCLLEKRGFVRCVGQGPDRLRFRLRAPRVFGGEGRKTARVVTDCQRSGLLGAMLTLGCPDETRNADDGGDDWLVAPLCASASAVGMRVDDAQREAYDLRDRGVVDMELTQPALRLLVLAPMAPSHVADLFSALKAIDAAAVNKTLIASGALADAAAPPSSKEETTTTTTLGDEARRAESALRLTAAIDAYFHAAVEPEPASSLREPLEPSTADSVRRSLKALLLDPRFDAEAEATTLAPELLVDPDFLARAAVRVLHGLASPAFPAAAWRPTPFWGLHSEVPFDALRVLALDVLRQRASSSSGSS